MVTSAKAVNDPRAEVICCPVRLTSMLGVATTAPKLEVIA